MEKVIELSLLPSKGANANVSVLSSSRFVDYIKNAKCTQIRL